MAFPPVLAGISLEAQVHRAQQAQVDGAPGPTIFARLPVIPFKSARVVELVDALDSKS